jgi:hypothetical protein
VTNSGRFRRQDEGSSEKGSKVVGSNHNTVKKVPIKTHALPQQRSTLVHGKHEGEKYNDYGEAEADP